MREIPEKSPGPLVGSYPEELQRQASVAPGVSPKVIRNALDQSFMIDRVIQDRRPAGVRHRRKFDDAQFAAAAMQLQPQAPGTRGDVDRFSALHVQSHGDDRRRPAAGYLATESIIQVLTLYHARYAARHRRPRAPRARKPSRVRVFRRCRTKNVYGNSESPRPPRKLHTYWREIRGESISTIFGSYAARDVRVRAMRSQYTEQKMERLVQGIPEHYAQQDERRRAADGGFSRADPSLRRLRCEHPRIRARWYGRNP